MEGGVAVGGVTVGEREHHVEQGRVQQQQRSRGEHASAATCVYKDSSSKSTTFKMDNGATLFPTQQALPDEERADGGSATRSTGSRRGAGIVVDLAIHCGRSLTQKA